MRVLKPVAHIAWLEESFRAHSLTKTKGGSVSIAKCSPSTRICVERIHLICFCGASRGFSRIEKIVRIRHYSCPARPAYARVHARSVSRTAHGLLLRCENFVREAIERIVRFGSALLSTLPLVFGRSCARPACLRFVSQVHEMVE